MKDVLVEWFGEDWYEKYWSYVKYIVEETRDAFENGFKSWALFFSVDDVSFDGFILFDWVVTIRDSRKVVKIYSDGIWCGVFDDDGNVSWTKHVVLG